MSQVQIQTYSRSNVDGEKTKWVDKYENCCWQKNCVNKNGTDWENEKDV